MKSAPFSSQCSHHQKLYKAIVGGNAFVVIHLIQHNDQKSVCPYCRKDVGDNWRSEFLQEMHYKTTNCKSCTKKVTMTVDFDGSGHDSWAGHERWKEDLKKKKVDKLMELVEEEYRYIEEPEDTTLL